MKNTIIKISGTNVTSIEPVPAGFPDNKVTSNIKNPPSQNYYINIVTYL